MYGLQPNHQNMWGIVNDNMVLQHFTAVEIQEVIGADIFQNYFKFAFVRNPFDKVVSEYHWYLKYGPKISFKEWVMGLPIRIKLNKSIHILEIGHNLPQYDFLFDKEGNLMVDFVGKFENLKRDFKKVQRKIECSKNLVHAEGTKAQRAHYKEYYDEESKNLVAELYCKDIDTFGYSF